MTTTTTMMMTTTTTPMLTTMTTTPMMTTTCVSATTTLRRLSHYLAPNKKPIWPPTALDSFWCRKSAFFRTSCPNFGPKFGLETGRRLCYEDLLLLEFLTMQFRRCTMFCFSGSGSFVEQWFCRNVE